MALTPLQADVTAAITMIAAGFAESAKYDDTHQPHRQHALATMRHGMNRFLALSVLEGQAAPEDLCTDVSRFCNEHLTSPPEDWFDSWSPQARENLHLEELPFCGYDPFANELDDNHYEPSFECWQFLDDRRFSMTENLCRDLLGNIEEYILYEQMRQLSSGHRPPSKLGGMSKCLISKLLMPV